MRKFGFMGLLYPTSPPGGWPVVRMNYLELVIDKSSLVKRFSFPLGSYVHYYLESINSPIFIVKLSIVICLILLLLFYTLYSQKRMKFVYVIFLLAFIFASYSIRYPHIDRPLSGGNEWVTAMSMIALENLASQGALPHNFGIIQTYPQPANKYINESFYMNEKGDGYYMSFPPFSIIFPFLIFKVLSLTPSVKNLQLLNMALHSIATIFLCLTIRLAISDTPYREFFAVFGGIIFIFAAPNLWYFSNVYSWDIFWHYVWVVAIYIYILLLGNSKKGYSSGLLIYLLGVINFILIYSDYHGILFVMSVISVVVIFKNSLSKKALISLSISSFLAIILIFLQYSFIAGSDNFLKVLFARGYDQSLLVLPRILSDGQYKNLIIYYLASFYWPIAVFLIFLIWIVRGRFLDGVRRLSETEIILLYLALFPVIVHHLIMMQWTMEHFFSIIKASVFFSIVSAILLAKIFTKVVDKKYVLSLIIIISILVVTSSIITYEAVFARGTEYGIFQKAGLVIKNHANDSDVVFASTNNYIYPQIIFYSKRNILRVANDREAKDWLRGHQRKTGMIFYFDDTFNFIKYEKVISDE